MDDGSASPRCDGPSAQSGHACGGSAGASGDGEVVAPRSSPIGCGDGGSDRPGGSGQTEDCTDTAAPSSQRPVQAPLVPRGSDATAASHAALPVPPSLPPHTSASDAATRSAAATPTVGAVALLRMRLEQLRRSSEDAARQPVSQQHAPVSVASADGGRAGGSSVGEPPSADYPDASDFGLDDALLDSIDEDVGTSDWLPDVGDGTDGVAASGGNDGCPDPQHAHAHEGGGASTGVATVALHHNQHSNVGDGGSGSSSGGDGDCKRGSGDGGGGSSVGGGGGGGGDATSSPPEPVEPATPVSVVPVEQALELTRLTQSHFDQFQATIAQQKNAWLQQQHDNRVASAGPALSDLDASAWRLALARAMGENESIAAGKRQQELKDVHRIVAAIKQARQATKEYELQRQGKASRTLSIRRRSKKSSKVAPPTEYSVWLQLFSPWPQRETTQRAMVSDQQFAARAAAAREASTYLATAEVHAALLSRLRLVSGGVYMSHSLGHVLTVFGGVMRVLAADTAPLLCVQTARRRVASSGAARMLRKRLEHNRAMAAEATTQRRAAGSHHSQGVARSVVVGHGGGANNSAGGAGAGAGAGGGAIASSGGHGEDTLAGSVAASLGANSVSLSAELRVLTQHACTFSSVLRQAIFVSYPWLHDCDTHRALVKRTAQDGVFAVCGDAIMALFVEDQKAVDATLDDVLEALADAPMTLFGVRERFLLDGSYFTSTVTVATGQPPPPPPQVPYERAIQYLRLISYLPSAYGKVQVLSLALKELASAPRQYYGDAVPASSLVVGADDLLPLVTYALVRARVRHVAAHTALMEAFLEDHELSGQYGFAVVTLATVLQYLEKDGRTLAVEAVLDSGV